MTNAIQEITPEGFLSKSQPETSQQKAFVEGIRAIIRALIEEDSENNNEDFVNYVREDFPPHKLFHPSILYRADYLRSLKALMKKLSVQLVPFEHCKKRLNSFQLAATIYDGEDNVDDKELAEGLIENYRNWDPTTANSPTNSVNFSNNIQAQNPTSTPTNFQQEKEINPTSPVQVQESSNRNHFEKPDASETPNVQMTHRSKEQAPPRVHHDIAIRFKNKEDKFSGELNQNWERFKRIYERVSFDYNLNNQQKLQFLHNLLDGAALDFYNDEIQNQVVTYEEAIKQMNEKFNSIHQQNRIKDNLFSIQFSKFENAESSKNEALVKLGSYISAHISQCPEQFRSDASKKEFLKRAVLKQPWATEPVNRMSSNPSSTFQSFLTDLAGSLQTHTEINGTSNHFDEDSSTYYQGQGRYRRPYKKFFSGGNVTKCWNCGKPGHKSPQCRLKFDARRVAANKINYYQEKGGSRTESFRKVLIEFAEEINTALGEEDPEENTDLSVLFLDSGDQEINSSETNNDYENFFNDLVQQSQEQSAGNGDEFSDIFISSNNSEKFFSVGSTTMNNFDNDDKYLGATKDIDKITLNCPQKEIIKRISDAQSSGKDITTVNISGINITKAENSENTFHGALLDTGAQKCVIGEKQARAYTHLQRQSFELLPSKEGFRFGKGSTKSMGILEMRIPIPNKRMALSWVTHTRPDISCIAAKLAQVTETTFDETAVKLYNSAVKRSKTTLKNGMIFKKLDFNSLYLKAYADSSFADNHDGTS